MASDVTKTAVDDIGANLARGALTSQGAERVAPLFRTVSEMLLRDGPVTIGQIATQTGRDERDIGEALAALEPVERDAGGRVIGLGLTLNPTPHRFRAEGRDLYTWCALDTLIFPNLLGLRAEVQSPCPATGTQVRVIVTPEGVTAVDPGTAVVSVVPIAHAANIRTAFCDHVHFFRSAQDAAGWLATHPGGEVLPVVEAFALGRGFAEELRR